MYKTLASYQLNLRASTRGLWSGAFDIDQALDNMFTSIDRGLPQAWQEGASECGVAMDELTPDERTKLAQAIANEKNHVFSFLEWVEANNKENGGTLASVYSRLDVWINRYRDLINQAKTLACGDMKMVWVLGPTEHCSTCAKLAGKVKRGSYWQAHVMPQNPPNSKLECGGWNCQCTLQPTSDRASPGPLPRLP